MERRKYSCFVVFFLFILKLEGAGRERNEMLNNVLKRKKVRKFLSLVNCIKKYTHNFKY
jgi:hypothetical protein